jgi:hypothetical protein
MDTLAFPAMHTMSIDGIESVELPMTTRNPRAIATAVTHDYCKAIMANPPQTARAIRLALNLQDLAYDVKMNDVETLAHYLRA